MKLTKEKLQQIIKEELDNLISEEDLGEKYPKEFKLAKSLIQKNGFKKAAYNLRSYFGGDSLGEPTRWNKETGLGPLPYGDIEPLLKAAEKEVQAERPPPEPPRKRELEPEDPEAERKRKIAFGKAMARGDYGKLD